MTGHASHDREGQSSPKQTRVEQSKEEQHRAYITILHIHRPCPGSSSCPAAVPCHTLPCLPCPTLPSSLSCAALLPLSRLAARLYRYIHIVPFIDPVSCKLILLYCLMVYIILYSYDSIVYIFIAYLYIDYISYDYVLYEYYKTKE